MKRFLTVFGAIFFMLTGFIGLALGFLAIALNGSLFNIITTILCSCIFLGIGAGFLDVYTNLD